MLYPLFVLARLPFTAIIAGVYARSTQRKGAGVAHAMLTGIVVVRRRVDRVDPRADVGSAARRLPPSSPLLSATSAVALGGVVVITGFMFVFC